MGLEEKENYVQDLIHDHSKRISNEVDYRIKKAFKNKGFDAENWTESMIRKRIKSVSFVDGLTTLYCDGTPICSYGFPTNLDFNVKEDNGKFTMEYNYKFEEH